VIECLPWSDFVARYDSPTTLFYLDPPYWGSETDYGAGRLFTYKRSARAKCDP
jgi:DNA adenine methylase